MPGEDGDLSEWDLFDLVDAALTPAAEVAGSGASIEQVGPVTQFPAFCLPKGKLTIGAMPQGSFVAGPATILHTDGGYQASRNLGAFAWHAELPSGQVKVRSVATFGTSNNRMELRAVLDALETLEIGPPITLRSDSEYVLKGLQFWGKNWIKNGWTTSEGKNVKNQDLWQPLLALAGLHSLTYEHVKGHSGDPVNDHVDELCGQTMAWAWEKHGGKPTVPSFDLVGLDLES